MPKRKTGLQKDVSSIFKGVPLSADDQVAALRSMPILDPPSYAPSEAQQTEVPNEPAPPARTETEPAPAKAGVESQAETSAKPQPDVSEAAPGNVISEKPSVEPQAQGETAPAGGGPVPEVLAAKKRKPAAAIKADKPGKGGLQKILLRMKGKLFISKPGLSSTKQKAMVVLVPALAIVLVFVLTKVVISPSHSVASDKQKVPATVAASFGGEINWKIPGPYPATLRDPMQVGSLAPAQTKPQVPQTVEQQPEKLIVRSILHTQNKPSAVIGAQIVHEGDVILGTTIVKIHINKVEFEKDGKTWTQEIEN